MAVVYIKFFVTAIAEHDCDNPEFWHSLSISYAKILHKLFINATDACIIIASKVAGGI
jgi:hypothetical protein